MILARRILVWWMGHDPEETRWICTEWRPEYILRRMGFEAAARVLTLIAWMYGFDRVDAEFIRQAMGCER